MANFVIGCTHFGHANIIRLTGRPFASVEEMDQALIANLNRVVGPKDTVWHLGDFAFKGRMAEHYKLPRESPVFQCGDESAPRSGGNRRSGLIFALRKSRLFAWGS